MNKGLDVTFVVTKAPVSGSRLRFKCEPLLKQYPIDKVLCENLCSRNPAFKTVAVCVYSTKSLDSYVTDMTGIVHYKVIVLCDPTDKVYASNLIRNSHLQPTGKHKILHSKQFRYVIIESSFKSIRKLRTKTERNIQPDKRVKYYLKISQYVTVFFVIVHTLDSKIRKKHTIQQLVFQSSLIIVYYNFFFFPLPILLLILHIIVVVLLLIFFFLLLLFFSFPFIVPLLLFYFRSAVFI